MNQLILTTTSGKDLVNRWVFSRFWSTRVKTRSWHMRLANHHRLANHNSQRYDIQRNISWLHDFDLWITCRNQLQVGPIKCSCDITSTVIIPLRICGQPLHQTRSWPRVPSRAPGCDPRRGWFAPRAPCVLCADQQSVITFINALKQRANVGKHISNNAFDSVACSFLAILAFLDKQEAAKVVGVNLSLTPPLPLPSLTRTLIACV